VGFLLNFIFQYYVDNKPETNQKIKRPTKPKHFIIFRGLFIGLLISAYFYD
jgi:hypothetical protein